MDPPRHNGLNMHLLNLILNVDCAESIHRSALTGWVLVLTLVGLSLRKTDDVQSKSHSRLSILIIFNQGTYK